MVVLLPTILTIVIFTFLTKQINENILTPMIKLLGLHFHNSYWVHMAKAAGFLIMVLLIILIGLATRLILLRNFLVSGKSCWQECR